MIEQELKLQKKYLIDYLLSKVSVEDWHAVQDAASDIREIEAKLKLLNQFFIGYGVAKLATSTEKKIGGGK